MRLVRRPYIVALAMLGSLSSSSFMNIYHFFLSRASLWYSFVLKRRHEVFCPIMSFV